jgi:hypothetical protein
MQTIDCMRSTNELTVICTGILTAPVAIDLETGAGVTLNPAQVNADLARFGIASLSSASNPSDAWWGALPMARERTEARLALVIDGVVQKVTARWPEPEPVPKSKRRRKGNVVPIGCT